MKTHLRIMFLLLSFISIQKMIGQNNKNVCTKNQKKAIISSIQTHLKTLYIDQEISNKMVAELQQNLKSKKYEAITNSSLFSKVLTNDLQNISNDLHLKVRFEPKRISKNKLLPSKEMQLKMEKKMAMRMAEINYGFTEVKILNGNIGYLNLRLFANTKYAEEAATAAMNFLSNTNAIIIDLRTNKGGVPNMMQLLSSYFLQNTPVLLNDFYERKTDTKTQLYSFANVKGKKSTHKPLYILTSKNTFSAAEAFTYTLKHLEVATVIGEVTKGGANRTKRININNEFTISIPYIKAIHPVTKTNWEGKGVKPHIETSEKDAFINAYINAIHKTVKRRKNSTLNKIGYTFLQEKSIDNAIIVFKENTKLFPNDANTWDSLGEAYFFKHDKKNALKSYKKTLELEPTSKSAIKMIQKLENIQ